MSCGYGLALAGTVTAFRRGAVVCRLVDERTGPHAAHAVIELLNSGDRADECYQALTVDGMNSGRCG